MDLSLALNIVTTIAVVGGVIFGARQIRVAAKTRETEVMLQLIEILNSRDLMEGMALMRDMPDGLLWPELQKRAGEQWTSVFTVINTLDGIGILVARKEVAADVADDFFHHAVAVTWQKAGTAIVERRASEPGREGSFRFLEMLAKAQAARQAKMTG